MAAGWPADRLAEESGPPENGGVVYAARGVVTHAAGAHKDGTRKAQEHDEHTL